MSEHKKSVRVRIEGRVQGVWYRGWTVRRAGQFGLDGWVRNRDDGSVEAVFAGPADKVDAMIEACRQGPPAARVTALRQMPFEEQVNAGFQQR